MGATMKVAGYNVGPVEYGDIHVELELDEDGGKAVVKVKQGADHVWVPVDDVDALIEALNEARRP